VLAKEADLDQAFAGARIDDAALHRMVADLGLQGEFRYTHLKYHLAMRDVLSPDQIAAYDRLRGYDSAQGPAPWMHGASFALSVMAGLLAGGTWGQFGTPGDHRHGACRGSARGPSGVAS
jgi:hypothetical protein